MSRAEDLELRQDVLEELEFDPSVDARTIGVSVEEGIVTLTGHVASYAERTSAEKIVKRVTGVEGVANELGVSLPALAERDDTDIARSAANALEWNASIPRDRIKASVTKGWITLDGDVDWHYQKRAAEDTVRNLTGVRGVTNKVDVTPKDARVGDIKEKIMASLRRTAEVDAKRIDVEASDGTVTLSGTVSSWGEREDAVNAAWSAPGVNSVVDHIRVQPPHHHLPA
ncbi:MAG TPA: BON domain-containing protein [Thermoanaerobaculia bacterium]|nr:BON domain-containing protein [Thermoanaerobaculia bacterium]